MSKTLFDKIWSKHVVKSLEDGPVVLYIDRHLIHEVTSPQAFKGIENRGLKVFRPQQTVATMDHNVPTWNQHEAIKEELSRLQVEKLAENCANHNIELYDLKHKNQGIVHVIGPELGITQPGMTIVCGDSHTSTHGAFGAIAFGIGTSEVEMVFATQCIMQSKPKNMKVEINGELQEGVSAKDVVLYVLSQLGAAGGVGHFVEFCGSTIRNMSMEGRMTVCNMSIEMGARGGLIAPDKTTLDYIKGKDFAPKGEEWDAFVEMTRSLKSDEGAQFDQVYQYNAADIAPMITYGTNPGTGIKINEVVPSKKSVDHVKSLDYMGFQEGEALEGKKVDYVFIGSCTNARIEDLRAAAKVIKGKRIADGIKAWIVPGSKRVELEAKKEGIDKIFEAAGFQLRQAGCSACLAMNEDKVPAGAVCVSTSNRNFEGRQGQGSKTLLASPMTAAAAAITGVVTDVRKLSYEKN